MGRLHQSGVSMVPQVLPSRILSCSYTGASGQKQSSHGLRPHDVPPDTPWARGERPPRCSALPWRLPGPRQLRCALSAGTATPAGPTVRGWGSPLQACMATPSSSGTGPPRSSSFPRHELPPAICSPSSVLADTTKSFDNVLGLSMLVHIAHIPGMRMKHLAHCK